jgi:hypothetical protein
LLSVLISGNQVFMQCLKRQWLVIGLALAFGGLIRSAAAAPGERPGAPAKPEVIGRIHFAGFQQLSEDSNGRTFKEIWNLPISTQLRGEALDRVATALALRFQPKVQDGPPSCAGLIRPLLNDLCNAESYAEAIEYPQNMVESVVAVRLDEARSRVWQGNWSQVLSGWKLRTAAGPAQLSFVATNSWFVLRCVSGPGTTGAGELAQNSIIAKIQQGQRPTAAAQDYWLKLDADLPRWAQWLSHPREDLPRLDLTMTGQEQYLRTQARLTFREPVVPRIEKWDVPMPTLHDPLKSFTALQGLAPWLKKQPLIQELGLEKVPNQLYLWSLSQTIFQFQAAVPVPDPDNAFERIAANWVPRFNRVLDEYALGDVRPLTNRTELMWRGLPILVPYLEPVREDKKGFLHAGIFPVAPPTNPPPHQLFQQLNSQTNLLCYDWEITQDRLNQLRPLLQLVSVFLTVSPMSTNSTASKWLDALEPRLGEAVTEVSRVSPREMNIVRKSHIGLNGLEILSLANWLEGTNFPRLNLNLGFRPVIRSRGQKPAH